MSGSSAPPIRVLLIDDHAMFRAGLTSLLAVHADILVVGEADTGEEGIRLWESCRPTVGLIDVGMVGIDGVEVARRIRRITPTAKLVMLTSSESSLDAARSFDAGAAAYVTKHSLPHEIVEVIRRVHAGHVRIQLGVRQSALPSRPELLTERELAVLGLMRQGCTNAEIGHQLGIAERTVKCHVTAIFAKVGAQDRAGAVARGFDLGLLEVARPPERGAGR